MLLRYHRLPCSGNLPLVELLRLARTRHSMCPVPRGPEAGGDADEEANAELSWRTDILGRARRLTPDTPIAVARITPPSVSASLSCRFVVRWAVPFRICC